MKRLLTSLALGASLLTGCFGASPLLPALPKHVVAVFITIESPENVSGASECVQVAPGKVALVLHTEEIRKIGGEAAILTALVTLASTCSPTLDMPDLVDS